MTPALWWNNLLVYSVQIALVVATAALVPPLLRLRVAGARLAFWQLVLAACLLLPFVHPWRQQVLTGGVSVTTTILAVGPPASAMPAISLAQFALLVWAAGAFLRFAWLAGGFWKLGRYRRQSRRLSIPLPWPSRAELRLAGGISSPVTFGALRPVVLAPPQFLTLSPEAQRAVLAHELLHVARGDWLFTVAEELIRSVLWFHPAIWWLLSEIQLCREQAVDAEVVRRTQAKDQYVDALLAIAGARPRPDLVPAPLFLRRRHLKQRVVSLFEEVRMSKTRLISALAAGLCTLFAACWFAAVTFPLSAAPQVVNDDPGVTVDLGGAALMHRPGVSYPESARAKNIEGAVTVEVQLDDRGNVADARVLSGPMELRNSTLRSVLQWHFAHDSAGSTRQVTVSFQKPAEAPSIPLMRSSVTVVSGGTAPAAPPDFRTYVVQSIQVVGLPPLGRAQLLAALPVHVGDQVSNPMLGRQVVRAVHEFDEHLNVTWQMDTVSDSGPGQAFLTITDPGVQAASSGVASPLRVPLVTAPGAGVARIRVGGNVQASKLISQPRPVYPPDAKAAGIQGKVTMQAVIGKDGTVQELQVLSGDPLLVPSAMKAVKQWVYQPTLLNGNPVEVQTQIDVNYTLSQ